MSKVFGYPEFDANGEQILTTYDNEYKDMLMDVRVYRMKAGDVKTFCKEGEETAVLLLSGDVVFRFDGQDAGTLYLQTYRGSLPCPARITGSSPHRPQ